MRQMIFFSSNSKFGGPQNSEVENSVEIPQNVEILDNAPMSTKLSM